jgi:zinc protease
MDLVAGDPAAWQTFPEALQKVTSDDVQRVARTYLAEDQRTTGWFNPLPQDGQAE